MRYFVTGATGFIGRHLVERLLEREGTIYVLVREGSRARLEELMSSLGRRAGPHRAGDRRPDGARAGRLGRRPRSARGRRPLLPPRRDLRHVRRRGEQPARERRGHPQRRRARERARRRALPPHQLDRGVGPLPGPVPRGHVRRGPEARRPVLRAPSSSPRRSSARSSTVPWRVYRPGDRRRPLADRRDGQDRRPLLLLQGDPAAARPGAAVDAAVGLEGGTINIVPVDFVAAAMDHIAHQDGLDGQAFHLTDPQPEDRRPGDQHVRARRACARGGDADRPPDDERGAEAGAAR